MPYYNLRLGAGCFARYTKFGTLSSQISHDNISYATQCIESIFCKTDSTSPIEGKLANSEFDYIFNDVFNDNSKNEIWTYTKDAVESFRESNSISIDDIDLSSALNLFGLFDAFIEIVSVCAFPLDRQKRDSLKNAIFASVGSNLVDFENVDTHRDVMQIIRNVAASPSLGSLFEDVIGNFSYFHQAGMIVRFLNKMRESGIEPSIRKAIYLLETLNRKIGINDGLCSEVSIRNKCWEPFKSVAHISAAIGITCQDFLSKNNLNGNPGGVVRLFSTIGVVTIVEFVTPILSMSEVIRKFLEQSVGIKSKVPLVDPEITWKVPPEIELPDENFTITPLSDEELSILRQKFKRA